MVLRTFGLSCVLVLAGSVLQGQVAPGRVIEPGGAERPADGSSRHVPFAPGETLTYDVSWSSFITAGTASLMVKEKKTLDRSSAYYIVAEGRTTSFVAKLYKLYYKMDTLLDASSLLPERSTVYSEEGRRRRTKVFSFDHEAHRAEYELQTATLVRKDLTLPPSSRDALAAMYVLRTLPLEIGQRVRLPVADSGLVYGVELTVKGREKVDTGIGKMMAWKVVPKIVSGDEDARGMTIWIGDDERRLPVRMQVDLAVGNFRFNLKTATGLGGNGSGSS